MFFFFNDTATTEIYTLSLHDALPICPPGGAWRPGHRRRRVRPPARSAASASRPRSEEHTSELQSLAYLVCRLLLEKKKNERPRCTLRPAQPYCSSSMPGLSWTAANPP